MSQQMVVLLSQIKNYFKICNDTDSIRERLNEQDSDEQVNMLKHFNIFEEYNFWCVDCDAYDSHKKHFTCCGDPLCIDCIVPVVAGYVKEWEEICM